MGGTKIWRKAVFSGKYFRAADSDLLPDGVGRMEVAGIFRAMVAEGRPLKLGAISVCQPYVGPI